ncbi:hypothetical protein OG21DRAFT_1510119 [Imleria badia]|nr:hypothetical protein OG21DRAFT_1510119 [Imleria badia]
MATGLQWRPRRKTRTRMVYSAQNTPMTPDIGLFNQPVPTREICTFIKQWGDAVPKSPSAFEHLAVYRVSLLEHRLNEIPREFLRVEVHNNLTQNTFIVIAQRNLCCKGGDTKGPALDECISSLIRVENSTESLCARWFGRMATHQHSLISMSYASFAKPRKHSQGDIPQATLIATRLRSSHSRQSSRSGQMSQSWCLGG